MLSTNRGLPRHRHPSTGHICRWRHRTDATSLVFTGAGGDSLGRYGYSKDHRPDLRQMFVAELLDGDGRPVCSEMWPGNTADVAGLLPVVDRVQNRLAIERICIVAYRGMISVETRAQ